MRILAIDLGEKRIGVAISDALGITAQGLTVLQSRGRMNDVEELLKLAEQQGAGAFVIGMPRNMDGSFGPAAEKVRKFVEALVSAGEKPVYLYDERLSTKVATRALLEGDVSRKKRKSSVDMLAAQVILQGYLENLRSQAEPRE
jgi:putative holliday junction resolvase